MLIFLIFARGRERGQRKTKFWSVLVFFRVDFLFFGLNGVPVDYLPSCDQRSSSPPCLSRHGVELVPQYATPSAVLGINARSFPAAFSLQLPHSFFPLSRIQLSFSYLGKASLTDLTFLKSLWPCTNKYDRAN